MTETIQPAQEEDSLGIAIEYLLAKERFKADFRKQHKIGSLRRILSEACSQVGDGVERDGFKIFLEKKTRHCIPESMLEKLTKISEEHLTIRKLT
jgi:hypothetical protein